MKNKEKLVIQKRSRKAVLEILQQKQEVWRDFQMFPNEYQEELLLFCMGEKGLRTTYDKVFKHIYNPEKHRERLEDMISAILGEPVKIIKVLQREGVQLKELGTFIIMDIVVKLADGSLVDVEMQKIGYRFPAERTDCYLADLLMRQYNDLQQSNEKFNYQNMSKVIAIIIMETSSEIFLSDHSNYIHTGKMTYDTGIQLRDLFENIYISLDTYKNFIHTKIRSKREAWMLFLASDQIEDIMEVCETYPEFIPIYREVFDFSNQMEELVMMFSDALREMDRNEERYMVEELRAERKKLENENRNLLKEKDSLKKQNDSLEKQNDSLEKRNDSLEKQNDSLEKQNDSLEKRKNTLEKTISDLESENYLLRKKLQQLE